MASLIEDIVDLLKSKSEAVSSPCGTRIFPADQVPQGMGRNSSGHFVNAFVTCHQVGGVEFLDHSGHSGKDDDQVQIDIYAKDKVDAQAVFDAIRPLSEYRGLAGTPGRWVGHMDVTTPADLTLAPEAGEEFPPTWFSFTLHIIHDVTVTAWS